MTYSNVLPDAGAENTVIVGPGDAVTGLGWSAPEGPDEAIALGRFEGSPVVTITQPNGDLISGF
ncbi:MAG: hypothetical protein WBD41_29935 [Rhodococcus sp. (in: high G+C Gram-positive bacteria)]|uniref:hypothetical protein n=1 Tax=Rhodococcus TaxID=1827 RepID=UPI0004A960BC|nr:MULTISPECIES: hypothetical protein [Rhodococcus]ANQ75446.1 hypothetical protein AOT96_30775 [Rhodococcus sp. 008]ARE37698.1 hypothetical protein A0W34_29600 [Rhodococcus sp. BH4]KDQ04998.1 hypothetical protein EN35_17845 [Rhodococcus qingshengii]KSU65434.1 hypothetical protein AS032_32700 [Rhodococcus qingshengii]KZF15131.1 hypothetical protein A2J01_32390 [Rhodococcus sp. EPR-134]